MNQKIEAPVKDRAKLDVKQACKLLDEKYTGRRFPREERAALESALLMGKVDEFLTSFALYRSQMTGPNAMSHALGIQILRRALDGVAALAAVAAAVAAVRVMMALEE